MYDDYFTNFVVAYETCDCNVTNKNNNNIDNINNSNNKSENDIYSGVERGSYFKGDIVIE